MESSDQICKLLAEIRDLLQSQQQRYDEYLKKADQTYANHLQASQRSSWLALLWLCVAAFLGAYAALTWVGK